MNQESAYILIAKVLTGEATAAEKAQVEAWRTADPENETTYQDIRAWWELDHPKPVYFQPDIDANWQRFLQNRGSSSTSTSPSTEETPVRRLRWGRYVALAASVIVLAVVYLVLRDPGPAAMQTFASGDEIKMLYLPDSSRVWLNKQSTIEFPEYFADDVRRVKLEGEAYFEVMKATNHPMEITAGMTRTEVLGTRFNLQARPEARQTVLQLKTGKVRFHADTLSLNTLVLPGQSAVYDKDKQTLYRSNEGAQYAGNWRDTILEFENDDMRKVFDVLSSYFGKEIIADNEAIYRCRLTTKLEDPKLESTLEIISQVLGLSWKEKNGKITFSGEGCPDTQ